MNHQTTVTEKLPFPDNMNFRELGGYESADGRHVKHHMFYRSGMLCDLTDSADRAAFEKLRIKTILDFRSNGEADAAPDPAFEGTDYVHVCALYADDGTEVDFSPSDIRNMFTDPGTIAEQTGRMLADMYQSMAFKNPGFRRLFSEIEQGNVPILFHCTAGKDRTGVAAMLILLALGVDEAAVLRDYELTNLYRKDAIEAAASRHTDRFAGMPELKAMFALMEGVDRTSAECTLNAIKETYGNYDAYFEAEYGLTNEKLTALRDRFLE